MTDTVKCPACGSEMTLSQNHPLARDGVYGHPKRGCGSAVFYRPEDKHIYLKETPKEWRPDGVLTIPAGMTVQYYGNAPGPNRFTVTGNDNQPVGVIFR